MKLVGFDGQSFNLLGQLQPALFKLLNLSIDCAQLLAGVNNVGAGQAGHGQFCFQCAAFRIQLGQAFVDLLELLLEGLGLFAQLLARSSGQAAALISRFSPTTAVAMPGPA